MVVGLESVKVIAVFTSRLLRDETFGVFRLDFFGDLHAVVADEVVNHFQPVKKGFFAETLTPEMEADRVEDFLVLNPCKVGPFHFEAGNSFDTKPDPSQNADHNRIQGDTPRNRRRDDELPHNNSANQIFSLKGAKELFIAPMFFVIESVKLFQHFVKSGVDVVEVEDVDGRRPRFPPEQPHGYIKG